MKIEILEPAKYELWDNFVEKSPQGSIFCYSWWLQAITKANFRLIAIFEDNEIVAGMPLAYDTRNMVNIPPLTRTLGILYGNKDFSSARKQTSAERKWLKELLTELPLENFVQMCTHHNYTDWLPFRWKGFSQTTRYTYIIDYQNKTIEDLNTSLEPETRRVISRAYEDGLSVVEDDNFELVYRYESLTYERQNLKFNLLFTDIKPLDEAISERRKRVILKAVDKEGRIHAVIYIVFNSKSAFALLSGSDASLRKSGGHTLVMWEAIKYFSGKVDFFNLGGSDIERIEAHLRGFGGKLTPYFHIYNEKLLNKREDLRYHLGKTVSHSKEAFRTIMRIILKIFQPD